MSDLTSVVTELSLRKAYRGLLPIRTFGYKDKVQIGSVVTGKVEANVVLVG